MVIQRYVYRGDKWTSQRLKGARCVGVHRADGKCIRGKNGSMQVRFLDNGETHVVIGRQLRKCSVGHA